jgi:PAS domain S-box-containing protein
MTSKKDNPLEMQNEESFQRFFENTPVGLYRTTPQGQILLVNPALLRMLGYESFQDLAQINLEEDYFEPEGSRSQFRARLESQGEVKGLEAIWKKKDGSTIYVHENARAVRDASGRALYYEGSVEDISESRQTQRLLAESEARYRRIVENSHEGIWARDQNEVTTYVNQRMAEMLGYQPEEMLGRRATSFIPEEDLADYHQQVQERNMGQPGQYERRFRRKDGSIVWTSISAAPLVDEQGSITGSFGMVTDITERKQAEQELERERNLLKALMDTSPDSIFFKDTQLRFLRISRTTALKEGLQQPEQMLGKTDFDFFDRESAQEFYDLEMEIMRSGQPVVSLELKEQRPGQPTTWASSTEMPLRDAAGQVIGVFGITRDITERKQMEQALVASEQRLRLAMEAANDGLWDWNIAAGQTYLSPRYYTMLGYSPDEFAADLKSLEFITHPDDFPGVVKAQNDYLAGRRDDFTVEFRALSKSGQVVWIRLRGKVVERDAEGRPARMLGTHMDITQSRLAEAALRESEARFHTLIDQAPEAILVSRAGINLYVNQKMFQLFGYSGAETPVGRPFVDYFGPPYREEMLERTRRRRLGLPVPTEFESVGLRRDGAQFPMQVASADVELSDGPAIISFVTDISELKQHEREVEAIAALSAALRSAVSRAEMLPVILDQVMELFQASGAILAAPDPSGNDLLVEFARGEGEKVAHVRIPAGSGVPGQVIQSGQPYLNNAANEDPLFQMRDQFQNVRALAGVPLIVKGSPIGALLVGRQTDFSAADLRLLISMADIAANALYRADLFDQTEQRLKYMTAIQQIDSAISSSLDLRVTFNVLLARTLEHLPADAADVLILDPHLHRLEYLSGRGFLTQAVESSSIKLGEGLAGRAALERRSVFIPDLAKATQPLRSAGQLAAERFVTYQALPLIAKGEVKGVLEVFYRTARTPIADALNLLETIAGQAAIAIDNAQLFQGLQRSNTELVLAYDDTIEGWAHALELRDNESQGHAQRVAELAVRLAARLGLRWEEQAQLHRGALLHDIGKMSVPDYILLKDTPLTEEETTILHQHPQLAFDMLSPIAYLRRALDIPYCHHERWDGSGYPRQLKGSQIPLAARIFTVVDVWDASISGRRNRVVISKEQALQHIREGAGTQFDPQVVEAFLKMMGDGG